MSLKKRGLAAALTCLYTCLLLITCVIFDGAQLVGVEQTPPFGSLSFWGVITDIDRLLHPISPNVNLSDSGPPPWKPLFALGCSTTVQVLLNLDITNKRKLMLGWTECLPPPPCFAGEVSFSHLPWLIFWSRIGHRDNWSILWWSLTEDSGWKTLTFYRRIQLTRPFPPPPPPRALLIFLCPPDNLYFLFPQESVPSSRRLSQSLSPRLFRRDLLVLLFMVTPISRPIGRLDSVH